MISKLTATTTTSTWRYAPKGSVSARTAACSVAKPRVDGSRSKDVMFCYGEGWTEPLARVTANGGDLCSR